MNVFLSLSLFFFSFFFFFFFKISLPFFLQFLCLCIIIPCKQVRVKDFGSNQSGLGQVKYMSIGVFVVRYSFGSFLAPHFVMWFN